jgi:uncharacterized protein (DUF1778 family)
MVEASYREAEQVILDQKIYILDKLVLKQF